MGYVEGSYKVCLRSIPPPGLAAADRRVVVKRSSVLLRAGKCPARPPLPLSGESCDSCSCRVDAVDVKSNPAPPLVPMYRLEVSNVLLSSELDEPSTSRHEGSRRATVCAQIPSRLSASAME
jgi:hypothetical protein